MRPAGSWAVVMALLLTVHPWIARNVQGLAADRVALWLLVVALAGSVVAIMARRQAEGAIQDIASTWFAAVYLGLLASFAVRMRQEVAGPGGAWLVLYFITVVKFTDIFAYGTGMAVGRHKLIPWLSPGKTVEGLIGGLAGAAIVAMLLLHASVIIRIDTVGHRIAPGAYVWAGLVGALLGGIGQIGDLMESLLKRGARQKDSAHLLPGFGGVFDLLDSPLLAAPAAWALFPYALAPFMR
jgi:phosphatidate cytidylyltransferase